MISVVLVTFNRMHLLQRSLSCYLTQLLTIPYEIIIVDDDSTDSTESEVYAWANQLDIKYIRVRKRGAGWRDCATNINLGIRASKGDLIIATHPEVMPGKRSLQYLWDARARNHYLACKIYYLTPDDQDRLDTIPWLSEGAGAVRSLPGFYQELPAEFSGNRDYTHSEMDKHTLWESWVFGGMLRSTWQRLGGMTEFTTWGSVDVDFMERRRILGIKNTTLMDPDTICVHQNHDRVIQDTDVLTPRDMTSAMRSIPEYRSLRDATRTHLWQADEL